MNVVLKRFMIFNSSEGQDEGRERDKLLYHWTKDAANFGQIDLAEQIDDICLCDASLTASVRLKSGLIQGTNDERDSFAESQDSSNVGTIGTGSSGCDLVLTFDSTVIVIVEVEPESSIWMAAHISQSQPIDGSESGSTSTTPNTENIPTDAIIGIIRNIYDRFCMINGTFRMMKDATIQQGSIEPDVRKLESTVREKTRSLCESYFNTILPEIHLNSIISNVASLYNHLVYLDLNPLTLMKVTSFINHLICIDPNQILHTIAIFNDQLLWSSLNSYDSRLVFNYMIGVLIRDALQEELAREVEKVRRIIENKTLYLTNEGTESLAEAVSTINLQENKKDNRQLKKLSRFYLTVFRSSNNMTLGILLKSPGQSDLIHKCEQILISDTRLGVIPLSSLAKSVGRNFLKNNSLANTSQTSQSSGAALSRRRQSASSMSSLKSSIPYDQKYLCLDRLDLSVSSSFGSDGPAKGRSSPQEGMESTTGRKSRLIKYLIELEPEMQEIHKLAGRRVEEYFVKTTSDTWLTVMNSKYRCIYSAYKMRNAGLTEAQQAATSLKQALVSSRPWVSLPSSQ